MSDGTYRGRWLDEVFRTPALSAEVKVFLLYLDRYYLTPNGKICEPREQLAATLKCHKRKVSAKFKAATDAGLLVLEMRGQKHRTSVYRIALPDVPRGMATSQGANNRHPEGASQGAGTRPAETSQGAGFYHPEGASQGAGTRPAETSQGAGNRHPENARSNRNRARPHSRDRLGNNTAYTSDSEHGDEAMVVSLFDEKTTTGKTQTPARKRASEPDDAAFAAFWSAYPRKVAKGAARKAWAKALKNGVDPADIVLGARRYATDPHRVESGPRYTAHPATWLSAERWADEDAPPPVAGRALVPVDRRQQATDDLFGRAMARARARDAQEAHGES